LRNLILATLLTGILTPAFPAEPAGNAPLVNLDRLTLQQAERYFVERNRELQLAQRAVEGSDADVLAANAPPNPALSIGTSNLNPSQGSSAGTPRNKSADTVIGVSQLFERGNKRELRTNVASARADASRSDRSEVERQQRFILHSAYYDLLLAQEKVTIINETAASYQRTLDATNLRLKAGDIAATDVARISVDALRAQNDARIARAELTRSQIALAYLIGAEREAVNIRAADAWPAIEPAQKPSDIEKLIEARADVRAARARLSAAERSRELAQSLRTRDITAGVQYEKFPGDMTNNTYGFFVSIPLFTSYYYEGEIRRAEADYGAASDGLERARAIALAEISRAGSDLDAAAERVRRSHEAVLVAAEKAATGAEFAYNRGAIGVMDLLDARRQYYATRLDASGAQADYAKAFAAWRASTTEQSDK
jgi:cobalt-zinc-cadmium efflux system outer membrane protein